MVGKGHRGEPFLDRAERVRVGNEIVLDAVPLIDFSGRSEISKTPILFSACKTFSRRRVNTSNFCLYALIARRSSVCRLAQRSAKTALSSSLIIFTTSFREKSKLLYQMPSSKKFKSQAS
jgi:hypothetical protein